MAEKFRVDAHYLYGYGAMLFHETNGGDNGNLHFMRSYVDNSCKSTDGYKGLMSQLKGPVDGYADALHNRLTNLMGVGYGTANELQHATWVYLEKEKENTHRMDDGSWYNAEDYAAFPFPESNPELKEPDAEIDWPAMFEQFGKDVKDIDFFISDLLGWQVHRELIVDLTGDWSDLAKAGQGLTNAGNAATTVSSTIATGLKTLDQQWDGAAAQACMDLVTKLYRAVDEEAALNRVVGRIYAKTADEVKKVAGELISTLNDVVKKVKSMLPDFWDGFWNMFTGSADKAYRKAAEYLCGNQELFTWARNLMNALRKLIDDVKNLIDALKKPIDEANKIKEDVDKVITEVKDKAELAGDLVELADPHGFVDVPTDQYHLPADPKADSR
ncbi:methyl-accepting chemotaxis protein [Labedaea rhizosphaerae]|uniref:Uncharacterized protein n=1 Tax=Labedaea rhizosphaerae TaxID=598644 RepID=A0A4R6SQX2_LABRH|nr:methyl-accepting chemotaxis protein [Labedaea rhizosphaerae]TDQ05962.1 hypothetical protein EV186_1011940 [Labedaea rhizosphaerae]